MAARNAEGSDEENIIPNRAGNPIASVTSLNEATSAGGSHITTSEGRAWDGVPVPKEGKSARSAGGEDPQESGNKNGEVTGTSQAIGAWPEEPIAKGNLNGAPKLKWKAHGGLDGPGDRIGLSSKTEAATLTPITAKLEGEAKERDRPVEAGSKVRPPRGQEPPSARAAKNPKPSRRARLRPRREPNPGPGREQRASRNARGSRRKSLQQFCKTYGLALNSASSGKISETSGGRRSRTSTCVSPICESQRVCMVETRTRLATRLTAFQKLAGLCFEIGEARRRKLSRRYGNGPRL